ncbi:MAG: creatininase family protein [Planctomycetes bacterium]|nr:creatininase family protein [Planctomycetota bacterium]
MALTLGELTYPEAEKLLPGAVLLLPVGAIEPHGPHLPLETDCVLAAELARRSAAHLQERGASAFALPTLPVSVTDYAQGFAGALSIPAADVAAYLRATALAGLRAGARRVAILTFHFDPGHHAVMRAAPAEANAAARAAGLRGDVILVDFTKRAHAQRIGGEFATGSCHGGSFESSLLLAARPDLVREAARRALPDLPVPLPERMRAGAATFRDCGMDQAYCGFPSQASAQEGERLYGILSEIITEAVLTP